MRTRAERRQLTRKHKVKRMKTRKVQEQHEQTDERQFPPPEQQDWVDMWIDEDFSEWIEEEIK